MPSESSPNTPNSNGLVLVARISLICPFLVVAVALLSGVLPADYRAGADIASAGLALVGLLCGITALVQGYRAAQGPLALQGGIGLVISLVFAGIVLNNYQKAQRAAQTELATHASSAETASSTEASHLAEALARFVGRTTELERQLVAASKPLSQSPVLDMTGVESPASLSSRRTMVEGFLECSHALSNHLAQSQAFIENQLIGLGTPAGAATNLATEFLKSMEHQLSASCQIREIEHAYSQTLLQALDVLKAQWGSWKLQGDTNPVFESESATREYLLPAQTTQRSGDAGKRVATTELHPLARLSPTAPQTAGADGHIPPALRETGLVGSPATASA